MPRPAPQQPTCPTIKLVSYKLHWARRLDAGPSLRCPLILLAFFSVTFCSLDYRVFCLYPLHAPRRDFFMIGTIRRRMIEYYTSAGRLIVTWLPLSPS